MIGDSIRIGYQGYVKERLGAVAKIYYPEDNCRFTQYIMRYANVWKEQGDFPEDADMVHWNVGLWDILRIMGDDVFTPPEFYAQNLRRLFQRFKLLFPNAKQVFALTTTVVEEEYAPPYQRRNADVELFNKVAVETLAPLGVEFDDLYTVSKNATKECRSDSTHFNTEEGIALMGEQVVQCLCKTLGIGEEELNEGKAVFHNYSKEIIGL